MNVIKSDVSDSYIKLISATKCIEIVQCRCYQSHYEPETFTDDILNIIVIIPSVITHIHRYYFYNNIMQAISTRNNINIICFLMRNICILYLSCVYYILTYPLARWATNFDWVHKPNLYSEKVMTDNICYYFLLNHTIKELNMALLQ